MGAVRQMTVFMRVPRAEFDAEEFSSDAEIVELDTHVRVTETYREVNGAEPDAHWSNRDGDTLDTCSVLSYSHLVQVSITWVDEFTDTLDDQMRWGAATNGGRRFGDPR